MKKLITILFALTLLIIPASQASAQTIEALNNGAPLITVHATKAVGPMASSVVYSTALSLTKNDCTVTYTFLNSTSGGVTAKLQKLSGSTWVTMKSEYKSFSYTTSTRVSIPVTSLTAGDYRVYSEFNVVIAGTQYGDVTTTGTYTLY